MKLIKYLIFAALLITLSSCHKDIDEDKRTKTPTPTAKIFDETTSSILGYVYDDNNQPVENATVSIYSGMTKTDKYGVFSFENIKMDKLGTYIKVKKAGYMLGSDKIYPDKGLSTSYIHLYNLDKTGEFSSDKGGTIELAGGGKIVFAANSIAKEDGTPYNGNVIVTAKKLDVNDEKIADKMPGALVGINNKGNTAVLGTMGMVAVELRDAEGNELNLKSGATASLTFPVNSNQSANASSEIPLWYFDEIKGLWIEEGKAILQDGKYIAEVPHFSWWNLDAKFDPIYMCVKVLFANGKPAVNYMVKLTADVIYPTTYGWTDYNGQVCGLVPKGKEIILEVVNPYCNEVVYKKTIGPFDSDVVLDDIIIPETEKLGRGIVYCNGDPIKNAVVVLDYSTEEDSGTLITYTDDQGRFELDFSLPNCQDVISATLFAYDPVSGDANQKINLNVHSSNTNISINICHNCDFTVDIVPAYGTLCDASTISLEAKITGSGDFKYLWSNGETGTKIDNLENKTYCVTVTDTVAQCDAIKCINVSAFEFYAEDSIALHPYCGLNNGVFSISLWGGIKPYNISVEGPNGFSFTSSENSVTLKDLEPGTYTTKVTDGGGCTKTLETILVNNKDHKVRISIPQACDSMGLYAYVTSSVNPDAIEYKWSTGQVGQEITVKTSGKYCVTATEGTSCAIDTCIDIEIEKDVKPPVVSNCNKNIYTISNIEKYPLNISAYEINTVDNILIEPGESYDFNVFEKSFGIRYYYEDAYCGQVEGQFRLPNLINGITVDSLRNISCPTCKDGQIFFTVNSGNDCQNCTVGNTYIYSVDDLDNDLSADNMAGVLDSGYYYIVVTDSNSDCVIDFKRVHLGDNGECLNSGLKQGLVAFYPFGNGSLNDLSGNNHKLFAGTGPGQNLPVITIDRNNNSDCAYKFNRGIEDAFMRTGDSIDLSNSGFTISLWYQALGDRAAGLYESLIKIGFDPETNISLGLFDCRKAVFNYKGKADVWDDEQYFDCDKAMTDHNWHHMVAIFDSQKKQISLYRNNVLMGKADNVSPSNNAKDVLEMGSFFNGKLDDVILYNRALSKAEINTLYNMGTCCEN